LNAILSKPLRLPCGAVLNNRLVKAAMTEGLADPMNRANEKLERLYGRWSEGGAGLLLTGNVQVDRNHLERPGNVAVDGNGGEDALRCYAKAGTVSGNHLWMQINHPGRQTLKMCNPSPLAPSAIPLKMPGDAFGLPRAMTETEIRDVVKRWAHVACVARDTGFTGVQIHAAHGYLLSQFLSPLANHRTDEWGGSLENRARFMLEVVRAVRKAVGNDFPVGVKMNSADFQQGGFSNEEATQVVRWLNAERIDLLELSGGNYEQPRAGGASWDVGPEPVRESTQKREAYFLEYTDLIKAVAQMPVMVTGGFRSRAAIVEALRTGAADLIGLARPMCTEPDFVRRLLAGETESAPLFERTLKLHPGSLGPEPDATQFRQVELWGKQGWFCLQLIRMGEGLDPDLTMPLFEAFQLYQTNEVETAARLIPR
jgi:2,4-dienoyl-CoA reductase-like NADH-dependent reductase (Old Yellow Enzyme family)